MTSRRKRRQQDGFMKKVSSLFNLDTVSRNSKVHKEIFHKSGSVQQHEKVLVLRCVLNLVVQYIRCLLYTLEDRDILRTASGGKSTGLVSQTSRSATVPTLPPVQWLPSALLPELTATEAWRWLRKNTQDRIYVHPYPSLTYTGTAFPWPW
jgi:hypothetical protein